ncbi:hypothetical protein D7W81_19180 [Corallococcus aberystwythensis]|uniref:Uncharacterized protein n=1 Tax=Corallococcus aberystwythensis TaxID=2316722 RepID=A0A3A8Q609_9BACT|nr:hypothetical protein D7W81_19180 [Corallococcus aberystwythensis]
MAKLMHRSPAEVSTWPWSDIVRLLAYSELEREEFDRRTQPHGSLGTGGQRASASSTTNTTVYRFGPKPTPKR